MEESDINSTKNKLFQKAFDQNLIARHNQGAPAVPLHQHQQFVNSDNPLGPPLSINLSTTDSGIEHAGFDYSFPQNQGGGQVTIGGDIMPSYTTESAGFLTGGTIQNNHPTEYQLRLGYENPNWKINVNHGTRGLGGGFNTRMQF